MVIKNWMMSEKVAVELEVAASDFWPEEGCVCAPIDGKEAREGRRERWRDGGREGGESGERERQGGREECRERRRQG